MPFNNLSNVHFAPADKTTVNNTLTALENALAPKIANLTAEERQKYGSVNEQNKLVINKVKDYRSNHASMSSPDVDWTEFAADYDSREVIAGVISRLETLLEGLNAAKILHDHDNMSAALMDYEYAKYKAGTNTPGYETKVNEIKQFFTS